MTDTVKVDLFDSPVKMKLYKIMYPLLSEDEKEVLEDLIKAALNQAKEKVEEMSAEEMKKLTGGLPLPPGMKMPF